jgi:hypothetical protein
MIISLKNKYIFICVSKTGTTSIERFLLDNDPSAQRNKVSIDGEEIHFYKHITALEVKNRLGKKYNDFYVFSFIRNPCSQWVSSYFFNKKGAFFENGKKALWVKNTTWGSILKVLAAKLLPFKLWVLLNPKSNAQTNFLTDESGNFIVSRIGLYENLQNDFQSIINDIGIKLNGELPLRNKSRSVDYESYCKGFVFKKFFDKKIKLDRKLYESILKKDA